MGFIKVLLQVDRYRKHADSDGGFFDSGSESEPGDEDTVSKITFDADVIVLHPGPKLEIAADGYSQSDHLCPRWGQLSAEHRTKTRWLHSG